jgi:hypothetical protein
MEDSHKSTIFLDIKGARADVVQSLCRIDMLFIYLSQVTDNGWWKPEDHTIAHRIFVAAAVVVPFLSFVQSWQSSSGNKTKLARNMWAQRYFATQSAHRRQQYGRVNLWCLEPKFLLGISSYVWLLYSVVVLFQKSDRCFYTWALVVYLWVHTFVIKRFVNYTVQIFSKQYTLNLDLNWITICTNSKGEVTSQSKNPQKHDFLTHKSISI